MLFRLLNRSWALWKMSPPVQAAMNSMYYAIVYPAAIQPNPDSIKGRGKIPMSRNRFLSITEVILTTYPLDLHHGSLSLLGDYFYQRIHLPESLLSVFWQKQTLALNQENRLANALVSYAEYNSLTDLLQYLHLSSFRPKSSKHTNKKLHSMFIIFILWQFKYKQWQKALCEIRHRFSQLKKMSTTTASALSHCKLLVLNLTSEQISIF